MNKLLIVFILLFTVQFSYSQSISSANNKIKDKKYAEAVEEFKTLYSENKTDIDIINGLIIAHIYNNEIKDAQKLAEKSIKEFPEDAQLHFNLGRLFNLKKQFEKAIDEFNKALTLNPENQADIYYQRGIANQNIDHLDDSTTDFEKAIELNPNSDEYYNFFGMTLYRQGNFEKAIEILDIALSFGSENPFTYFNQGMAYLKISDKYNGCMALQKSCKLGNKNACKMYINDCVKLR